MQTDLRGAAEGAVAQSRSFISDQLDQRTTQLGDTISTTASDLRRIADDLRSSQTVGGAAELAQRGADAIDRVAQYLRSADGDRLIADAEDFARQRPLVLTLAALATGFAASRVLKASSSRRYRSYSSYSGYSDSTDPSDSSYAAYAE